MNVLLSSLILLNLISIVTIPWDLNCSQALGCSQALSCLQFVNFLAMFCSLMAKKSETDNNIQKKTCEIIVVLYFSLWGAVFGAWIVLCSKINLIAYVIVKSVCGLLALFELLEISQN